MSAARSAQIADALQFGTKSIGTLGSVAVLLNNILGSLDADGGVEDWGCSATDAQVGPCWAYPGVT